LGAAVGAEVGTDVGAEVGTDVGAEVGAGEEGDDTKAVVAWVTGVWILIWLQEIRADLARKRRRGTRTSGLPRVDFFNLNAPEAVL